MSRAHHQRCTLPASPGYRCGFTEYMDTATGERGRWWSRRAWLEGIHERNSTAAGWICTNSGKPRDWANLSLVQQ
jgi:hypothetical protein